MDKLLLMPNAECGKGPVCPLSDMRTEPQGTAALVERRLLVESLPSQDTLHGYGFVVEAKVEPQEPSLIRHLGDSPT